VGKHIEQVKLGGKRHAENGEGGVGRLGGGKICRKEIIGGYSQPTLLEVYVGVREGNSDEKGAKK